MLAAASLITSTFPPEIEQIAEEGQLTKQRAVNEIRSNALMMLSRTSKVFPNHAATL